MGNCEIIKDKTGNKYLVTVVNDVQRVVPIPSEDLSDTIRLILSDKGESLSKQKINSITEELRALALQVEDEEEVNLRKKFHVFPLVLKAIVICD